MPCHAMGAATHCHCLARVAVEGKRDLDAVDVRLTLEVNADSKLALEILRKGLHLQYKRFEVL